MIRLRLAAILSGALLAACQSTSTPAPAVLVTADDATMDKVRAVLAQAMGRASVDLGPGDPTVSPVISVLPRPPAPMDDRSLARPVQFRLELHGADCFLVREETGERHRLDGVACRRATS